MLISKPRPVMVREEYKSKKARSGITQPDTWCAAIRITKDQDKAYSASRTEVPQVVADRVRHVVSLIEEAATELHKGLADALPECDVGFDEDTLDISVQFPSGKKALVKHAGLDNAGLKPLFLVDAGTRNEAVFLYTHVSLHDRVSDSDEPLTKRWYLWRGDFAESRNLRRFQGYENALTQSLLMEALKRYL